ncbi:O-antigen ligase family protein [Reichenbachiella ulvae]|uniref:O-antigen ligase family protein n=1 Tax=Reichenbachiella ulvae TaxID=2980104 RepID=A0ABT3CNK9_9BACT|nr:O-antigen ligase family protein [Reichenbachiella ulvae]MCV9385035.1 O-antigen ligase family protein [Reichenbachiella ulvae]
MDTPIGTLFFVISSVFVAIVSAKLGLQLSIGILGLLIGSIVFLLVFISPKYGYFLSILIPFIFILPERKYQINVPVGLFMQILPILGISVIVLKKLMRKDFSYGFLWNGVTYCMLAILAFNVFQIVNPNGVSIVGTMFVLKGSISILCCYALVLYVVNKRFLRTFLILWLSLAFISAVYGCVQEWFGLMSFEEAWVRAEELRYKRIFVAGRFRKFSLLTDPASFGIFMSSSGLVCLILCITTKNSVLRWTTGICVPFMLLAMGYSGTRTAYAMFAAGLMMYGLMSITKPRTMILIAIGGILGVFILFGPIQNPTIARIRSTFDSDDPSLGVRDENRKYIQSYIHQHPLGGGLVTTGPLGEKYNPGHVLAGFPPDSGYLQRALEIGPIGLAIFMIFLFVGLKNGIVNYFHLKNEELKMYTLAFVIFTFAVTVSIYAQIATTAIPMSYIFYPVMGIMSRMKDLDFEN